jgi:uncharacterized membrane protein
MQPQSRSPGKGARLFGHPVHPMLTDFPIALWSTSLLGDILGVWLGQTMYEQFAVWSIALGLIIVVPTIVTGLIDFAAIPEGHPALNGATWHMWIMLSAASTFGCSLIARIGQFSSSTVARDIAIGLSVLGLCLLLIGGWFGGDLVFRHGVGSRGSDGVEPQWHGK